MPLGPLRSTRLFFIVARAAPVAVVFRRGPTRHIELLTWDLETDRITPGQWLKGRIYERNCDLSPSGELLIYFAAKWETPLMTWTAVSRPPYLTALALWPKGDAWGGGGLFDDERSIRLNHRSFQSTMPDEFHLPPDMLVTTRGEGSGWAEDQPILDLRLERDGWRAVEARSREVEHADDEPVWITYEPPIRYHRPLGRRGEPVELELAIEGVKERQGSFWVQSFRLRSKGETIRDLGRADWADRGPDGSLLLARGGRLWRLRARSVDEWRDGTMHEVADLRHHRFESRTAPARALRW